MVHPDPPSTLSNLDRRAGDRHAPALAMAPRLLPVIHRRP